MQNTVKYNLCSCILSVFHTAVCLQLLLMAVNGSLYFEEENRGRMSTTLKNSDRVFHIFETGLSLLDNI